MSKRNREPRRESRQRGKLNRNPAALFAVIIIALSGFLFPIFNSQILEENLPNKKGIIFNFIGDLFTGKLSLSAGYEIVILGMIIIYIIIFLLYLLNGLGIIYNRYSRYASILTIIFLFLGLIAVLLLNREKSISLLGFTLTSVTIGLGTYLVTIVGVAYLFLARKINQAIRF